MRRPRSGAGRSQFANHALTQVMGEGGCATPTSKRRRCAKVVGVSAAHRFSEPSVLIISGPIASGKSTVAQALAADSRVTGANTVVIDLDRMYMMLDDGPVMNDAEVSRLARRATAALIDHYILDGLDLIIAEGDFWTPGQRDEFTCRLTSGVAPVFVTLRVSVEEALRRVQSDPSRRLSRIPEVLRRSHAEFAAAASVAGDVTIDSTSLSITEVAARIRSVLDRLHSARTSGDQPLFRDVDCVQIPVPVWQPDLRSIAMRSAIS